MATIQDSINYSSTFIQYSPLSAGTNFEPALTIANEIQNTVMGAPFSWPWNRTEDNSTTTVAGTQDYSINLTNFAWLEKVSLKNVASGEVHEIPDVYNNLARGIADARTVKQARPNAACVLIVSYGSSLRLRLMGVPETAYLITLTYQRIWAPLTTLTGGSGTWTIPPQYSDIYNNLFLGEAMALVDDRQGAQQYRQRGIAALIAKAEGLTQMQINSFLEQYWQRDSQMAARQLAVQQGGQARGV
jgi:hypothetical protein